MELYGRRENVDGRKRIGASPDSLNHYGLKEITVTKYNHQY